MRFLFASSRSKSVVAPCRSSLASGLVVAALLVGQSSLVWAQASGANVATAGQSNNVDDNSPVRLRQPAITPLSDNSLIESQAGGRMAPQRGQGDVQPYVLPYALSEFERYVQQLAEASELQHLQQSPQPPRRFGSALMTEFPGSAGARQDPLPAVPGDYIVKAGDEIQLTIWGSVDADLRLVVDRVGRIAVPRVGAIQVAGLRNADLNLAISRQVSQVFRNFQLSAVLGQVRPVRVFVTGYASRPGSLTVSGLSSVLHVLMRAGGPSAAGSFRDISLRRAGQEVARLDLYDLLLKGDRKADQLVQADDVVHIGPVGAQIGVIGSVNQAAVFELRPGETLADALRMAGGFSAVADRSRVTIERLADRLTGRVVEWSLPSNEAQPLASGDVIRAYSAIAATLPEGRQKKRVRVEGEVVRPGDYVLPPGATVADALKMAGGLTQGAYLFGADFSRESVRRLQQANYDRALRDLETEIAKAQAGRRITSVDEAANQTRSEVADRQLLERLRQLRPTGRIVLQVEPTATELPDLPLEDGDRLSIPSRAMTIGVFGSVFNAGSFVYSNGWTVQDYLKLAGGATRGADKESMFLLRANGSVVSAQQSSAFWLTGGGGLKTVATAPGDALFVPENLDKTTLTQNLKDWSQIFYQFGLGIAGVKALGL